MEKIIVFSNSLQNFGKCVQFDTKIEEKSQNAQNIDLMFFWNAIPSVVKAYEAYCDVLKQIYSINHNFVKCDNNGRKT